MLYIFYSKSILLAYSIAIVYYSLLWYWNVIRSQISRQI